jgi:hypothetical protein
MEPRRLAADFQMKNEPQRGEGPASPWHKSGSRTRRLARIPALTRRATNVFQTYFVVASVRMTRVFASRGTSFRPMNFIKTAILIDIL